MMLTILDEQVRDRGKRELREEITRSTTIKYPDTATMSKQAERKLKKQESKKEILGRHKSTNSKSLK